MPSIAIVDDDARCREEIAEAARVFMDAQGEEYRVTAFADAASFLADAATRPFDIAILDIIMPEKMTTKRAQLRSVLSPDFARRYFFKD